MHLVLKSEITKDKLNAIIAFLKAWNIEAELVDDKYENANHSDIHSDITKNAGMWQDYDIDAKKLRESAWQIKN